MLEFCGAATLAKLRGRRYPQKLWISLWIFLGQLPFTVTKSGASRQRLNFQQLFPMQKQRLTK
jgi:hypothetical protein